MNSDILIYGVGRSGVAAVKVAHKFSLNPIVVNRGAVHSWQKPELGKRLFSEQDAIDNEIFLRVKTIVLSPGIPRYLPHLQKAIKQGIEVISEIEFAYRFLNHLQAPIIAVTGTNGKTTTTTMLQELFRYANKYVFIGGNIGTPFCEYILQNHKSELIILELSSFQLESMTSFKVDTALILNLFQNHGERYEHIEDYARAKFHITDRMSSEDLLIYPVNYPLIQQWAELLPVTKISFDENSVLDETFLSDYNLKNFKLIGEHNYVNLYCALLIGNHYRVTKEAGQQLIDNFCGVPFRLQYLSNPFDISIYNDAKSTNWNATVTAIRSFSPNDKIKLIIGGQFRGHGDSIIEYLPQLDRVDEFILIGETTDYLADQLIDHSFFKAYTLDAAKDYILKLEHKATIVFSPAYPSFDQFENYVARGEYFNQIFSSK
jgi:UDP-N-acetylmuramoylalanine--D-glutamate ligase